MNEVIEEMDRSLLRTVLDSMKVECPAWFSVIADKATDKSSLMYLFAAWIKTM